MTKTGNQTLLIIVFIILLVISVLVVATVYYLKQESNPVPQPQQTAIPRAFDTPTSTHQTTLNANDITVANEGAVTIPESIQHCQKDDECAVVSDHCGGCSCGEAINKKYVSDYNSITRTLCRELEMVLACDMMCEKPAVACVRGLCRFSKSQENR